MEIVPLDDRYLGAGVPLYYAFGAVRFIVYS